MYVLSPIMPHLAEEVLHRTQRKTAEMTATTFKWDNKVRLPSIMPVSFADFCRPPKAQNWRNEQVRQEMQPLLAIRQQVMQLLEEARTAKYVSAEFSCSVPA